MKAILLATNAADAIGGPFEPAALRTLIDRPLLQHAVEQLSHAGISQIEVVTGIAPEAVQGLLGDGRRWGCGIRYHLAQRDDEPVRAIQRAMGEAPMAILVRADHFIELTKSDVAASAATVYASASDGDLQWAGSAIVSSRQVADLPQALRLPALGSHLLALADRGARLRAVPRVLRVTSLPEWIDAQAVALAGEMPALRISGSLVATGVRVGRGARMHRTVTIVAPVFIGADARIEAGAVIGPNAIIGAGAIVDRDSWVANSIVMPRTYIGAGLELREAVASPSAVASARHASVATVTDSMLLGAVKTGDLHGKLADAAIRGAALLMWVLGLPAAALARVLARGREEPAATATLSDLCLRVVPGLFEVAAGRLALVGDTAPSATLSESGLIAASQVICPVDASVDDRWSADAIHKATASRLDDVLMLIRYVGRAVRPSWPARAPAVVRLTAPLPR